MIKHGLDGKLREPGDESTSGACTGIGCTELLVAAAAFMAPAEALAKLRDARPESVETVEQEEFIREYAQLLWRRMDEELAAAAKSGPAGAAGSKAAGVGAGAAAEKKSPRATGAGAGGGTGTRSGTSSPSTRSPSSSFSAAASGAASAAGAGDSKSSKPQGASPASTARSLGAGAAAGEVKAKTESKEEKAARAKAVKDSPRFLMLVGVPGSGKTTFGQSLERLNEDSSLNVRLASERLH